MKFELAKTHVFLVSSGVSSWTYLLISSEWTLYRLSILYLPGLARGSIATLFLYLEVVEAEVEVECVKEERGQQKKKTVTELSRHQTKEENPEDM